MKRPLSKSQCVCIVLLWALVCYMLFTKAVKIDGPLIISVLMGSALVWIPVVRSLKQYRKDKNR